VRQCFDLERTRRLGKGVLSCTSNVAGVLHTHIHCNSMVHLLGQTDSGAVQPPCVTKTAVPSPTCPGPLPGAYLLRCGSVK
jgi:hypothetical protein